MDRGALSFFTADPFLQVCCFWRRNKCRTGDFSVTAQKSSGALSPSQTLALTVEAGVVPMLPRTAYARTDSVATADASLGEPHIVTSLTISPTSGSSLPTAP